MYNSDAKQDQFVNLMLKKNNGIYVDIGSCHSSISNNSYYFDNLGWSGICVELNNEYSSSYNNRKKCMFLNQDALEINYSKVFSDFNFPSIIDYLSLDVDTLSLDVLSKLPFDEYKFSVITIEHDYYLYGDLYQKKQREILNKNGYYLICSDVYVQQSGFNQANCSFEDWWIRPELFDSLLIDKISSQNSYPSDIINKFKN